MRKGWVAWFVAMMVLMMPADGFAFELGVKYGVTKNFGSVIGCQVKKHAKGSLFWGVHVGHSNIKRGESGSTRELRYIEIYPFIDFYPYKSRYANFFLRSGLGLNRWDFKFRGENEADDFDPTVVLGAGVNFLGGFELSAIYNRIYTSDIDDVEYLNFTIGYNFDFSPKIEAQF